MRDLRAQSGLLPTSFFVCNEDDVELIARHILDDANRPDAC